jgi:hypothetical protein
LCTERTKAGASATAWGTACRCGGGQCYQVRHSLVARIFMKLGVSSRVQLAAEVIRQPGRG